MIVGGSNAKNRIRDGSVVSRTSLYFWGKPLTIIAVQTGNHETNDHMAAP